MIIRTKDEISTALELLQTCDLWTYDVETTGLNVRKEKIIGFGCASPVNGKVFYIITHEWTNGQLVELLTKEDVLPVLKALEEKRLIGWNFSFDSRITFHYYGVKLWSALYADAMLMKHTLNENAINYKLKDSGVEEFGSYASEAQAEMLASIKANGGSEKEYYKADSYLMAKYGLQDNLLTAQLFNLYNYRLKNQGLTDFFYDMEVMPLLREVTIPMELRGVPVNVDYLRSTQAELETTLTDIEDSIQQQIEPLLTDFNAWYLNKEFPVKLSGPFLQKLAELENADLPRTKSGAYSFTAKNIEKMAPCLLKDVLTSKERISSSKILAVQKALLEESGIRYPFNILSKDHLKRLFFIRLGETPLSKTELGNPQVNDDFLELMAQKYEWAAQLQAYNSLTKLKGTYVDRVLEFQENSVFYPQFFMHRTTSGRFSGDAQQLPRKKSAEEIPNKVVREYTNRIRDFFVSAQNWKFVDADYSSLEVVVFADDAQDEPLMDIIKNDYDLYSIVAIDANGLEGYSGDKKSPNFLKTQRPELRQAAKEYALGARYGLQAYLLSKKMNVSETEAKSILDRYFKAYPKLRSRMDELITSAKKLGYVKSKAGRIRHLDELKRLDSQYGSVLYDGLEMWKKYHEDPKTYEIMKKRGSIARNLVNNALNFPIQSMAASIVSRASIAIMREFAALDLQAYIALSVHDELCVHCPDEEVSQVSEIMRRCMEHTTELSVPLTAEPIVGTVYGEVK